MRVGYRKGADDIPMDHREESQHHAIRREPTGRYSHGSAEGHQTRHRELPRSVQTTVQVTSRPEEETLSRQANPLTQPISS